jgi:endonuclease YncB( thermonuclease family)
VTEHTWKVRAVVKRIVDGDTFVADLDLGWGTWRLETARAPSRVRVLGYRAPERGQPGYAEAIAALSAILPPGSACWVESTALDSFGRALCHCYLADGTNLLDLMPQQWREKTT